MDLVELAAGVGPAGHFEDRTIFIERAKTRIGICLKRSSEELQMSLRMFAAAVGRVGEPHGRRRRIAAGTAVAHIGPEAAGLGSSVARREHRDGRVVGVQLGG